MSYRKRRLIVIQLILLSLAIILFYFFYYQNVDKDQTSQTTKVEIEKTNNLDDNASFFENVEYKGIDANGNRYLLQSSTATFNKENPELVNMMGMRATFYFKDGKILEIFGDAGKYNNQSNDMEFRKNVKVKQDQNEILADNLDYFNIKKLINIYGNVKGKSLDGNFSADVLKLNIGNQSADIFTNNEDQVQINVTKWKKVLE